MNQQREVINAISGFYHHVGLQEFYGNLAQQAEDTDVDGLIQIIDRHARTTKAIYDYILATFKADIEAAQSNAPEAIKAQQDAE